MTEATEAPRSGSGPTRRQVMTAAAWGAPVVLAAVAAPGAAASGDARVSVVAITAIGDGTVVNGLANPPFPWQITVTVTNYYTTSLTVMVQLIIPPKAFFVPGGPGGTVTEVVPPGTHPITGFSGLLQANNKQQTLTANPVPGNAAEVEWTGESLTVPIKPGHPIPYRAKKD